MVHAWDHSLTRSRGKERFTRELHVAGRLRPTFAQPGVLNVDDPGTSANMLYEEPLGMEAASAHKSTQTADKQNVSFHFSSLNQGSNEDLLSAIAGGTVCGRNPAA